MVPSTAPATPPGEAAPVRTLAKADAYTIVEAARVYRPHPDGLPSVEASQLLVGYPGAGKTLVLKKLCWDLLFEPQYVPVYIAIEAYVAMVASEATYTPDVKLTKPDAPMRACINFLLGLAIVDGVMDAGWPRAAAPAIETLSRGSVTEEPIASLGARYQMWKREHLQRLTATLSYGADADPIFSEPPTVFSLARLMADRIQRTGKPWYYLSTRLIDCAHSISRPCRAFFAGASTSQLLLPALALRPRRRRASTPARSTTPHIGLGVRPRRATGLSFSRT